MAVITNSSSVLSALKEKYLWLLTPIVNTVLLQYWTNWAASETQSCFAEQGDEKVE